MVRKKLFAAATAAVIGMTMFGGAGIAIAHEGHEHDGAKGEAVSVATPENEVICPVSGEKIAKDAQVAYTYEGKIYPLCCSDCYEKFKADPEKYIGELNADGAEESEHHGGDGHDHN